MSATQPLPMLQPTRPPEPRPGPVSTPSQLESGEVAPSGRRVYVETYGCQMNVADTELISTILTAAGFSCVDAPQDADVILINTCAVREKAEERVIGRAAQLSGLRAQNPSLTIGILGCMAQHLAKTLPQRAPFVDLVMGPDSYQRLPALLDQTSNEALLDVRLNRTENYVGIDAARKSGTNAWITIIRGCDKFCTFCVVPYVRGRERSLESAEVLRQVRQSAARGFREVTLLGQTVNSYDDGDVDFADLLRSVAAVDGIERARFTSPYPKDFNDRTITAIADIPEVCPALHLPVQSGSDSQLERMRRGYAIGEYRDLVSRLRDAVPELALTTDIIVGFCGETDEDFQSTVRLMEDIRFDSAFMFKYSERTGTVAHRKIPDDIPEDTKGSRLRRIIELQEGIALEVNQRWVSHTVEVLVEGVSKRKTAAGKPNWFGRSLHGKVVVFPPIHSTGENACGTPDSGARVTETSSRHVPCAGTNSVVQVEVHRATSHTLYGNAVTS